MSNTFNVADLSPFLGPEESESRSTLFEEGEDDEDMPNNVQYIPHDVQDNDVYKGLLTRARAQLLHDSEQVAVPMMAHQIL